MNIFYNSGAGKIMVRIVTIVCLFVNFKAIPQDTVTYQTNSELNRKTLFKAAAFTGIYYAGSMVVMQNTWYKGRAVVPFHFYNDNQGYLQVDKFGHAYGAYVMSFVGYHSLIRFGVPRNKALIYGGSLGMVLQTPVEIMDGIHEGWGFSWGDMAANAIGSGLVVGQELLFKDQIVRYKFSYWESPYAKQANGYLGESTLQRVLDDYNGHTYWFSAPINKMMFNKGIPHWLNIAVGYGANGMYGEYENISSFNGVDIPETTRYRQFLLSLDINWSKLPARSSFVKGLYRTLDFIKIPFPTLEYNSKKEWVWYWLYM